MTGVAGTKLGCGEGGCGACAVVLSRIDPSTNEPVYVSANSCLRPLASMDGWSVTTSEGLGAVDSQKGLHPVQDRMRTMNATQCGFCTPGMCRNAAVLSCPLPPCTPPYVPFSHVLCCAALLCCCALLVSGMVCTLYARLKGAQKAGGLTMKEIESTYDGS
jgi:hypothetical protein